MAVTEFNLAPGQRAERKLLITVAEWQEDESPVREILGVRTTDSSIEYNLDSETSTDILGITYTDINKMEATQNFDPAPLVGGAKLQAKLRDIIRRNALSELAQFTVYTIEAYAGSDGAYEADKQINCTISPTSLGGESTVEMPFEISYSNNKTLGKVDKLTDDFQFTEDGVGGP